VQPDKALQQMQQINHDQKIRPPVREEAGLQHE